MTVGGDCGLTLTDLISKSQWTLPEKTTLNIWHIVVTHCHLNLRSLSKPWRSKAVKYCIYYTAVLQYKYLYGYWPHFTFDLIYIHESKRIELFKIFFSSLLDISGDPTRGPDPKLEKHWSSLNLCTNSNLVLNCVLCVDTAVPLTLYWISSQ